MLSHINAISLRKQVTSEAIRTYFNTKNTARLRTRLPLITPLLVYSSLPNQIPEPSTDSSGSIDEVITEFAQV